MSREGIENPERPITDKEMESRIKNCPQSKASGLDFVRFYFKITTEKLQK